MTDSPATPVLDKISRSAVLRPVCYNYKHDYCGFTTMINPAIAETFAADPGFYTKTYCSKCGDSYPVDEFVWVDDLGGTVGSIPPEPTNEAVSDPEADTYNKQGEQVFTPPPINGYRELSKADIEMINDIKGLGEEMQKRVDALMADEQTDKRWIAIGATHLQQGCMALTRSITKPTTFA